MKYNGKNMVLVRFPRKDWELFLETLQMDSRSGAFDPKLRKRLELALSRLDVHEMPSFGRKRK